MYKKHEKGEYILNSNSSLIPDFKIFTYYGKIKSSMFIDLLEWEKVSFELGKEIEKDVFCLISSMGQSPHEESNHRCSNSVLPCSTTEPQKLYGE